MNGRPVAATPTTASTVRDAAGAASPPRPVRARGHFLGRPPRRTVLTAVALQALAAAWPVWAQPSPAAAQPSPSAASAPRSDSVRSSAVVESARLDGAALLQALRRGGHVVYFRHTATDFSRRDDAMRSVDDCANQRPLSERGRDDARVIGEQVAALALPLGEVLASPMCRTMDHARLAFGARVPVPTPSLRERGGGDYPGLSHLLAAPVKAGTNRWLVGHGIPFREVAGPPHLAEGEAVVLRPDARGGWSVVARLQVADWAQLPRR